MDSSETRYIFFKVQSSANFFATTGAGFGYFYFAIICAFFIFETASATASFEKRVYNVQHDI